MQNVQNMSFPYSHNDFPFSLETKSGLLYHHVLIVASLQVIPQMITEN